MSPLRFLVEALAFSAAVVTAGPVKLMTTTRVSDAVAMSKGGINGDSNSYNNDTAIECVKTQRIDYMSRIYEQRYQCQFPDSKSSTVKEKGTEEEVRDISDDDDNEEETDPFLAPRPKPTLRDAECTVIPPYTKHDTADTFAALFYQIRNLENQTCLLPGEALEYGVLPDDWRSDWYVTVINTGSEMSCEWTEEISNIAYALYYVCVAAGLGGKIFGGEEIESVGTAIGGRKKDATDPGTEKWRWCLRFANRGWGEEVWQQKCFGGKLKLKDDEEEKRMGWEL